jgi:hypothetical protein
MRQAVSLVTPMADARLLALMPVRITSGMAKNHLFKSIFVLWKIVCVVTLYEERQLLQ